MKLARFLNIPNNSLSAVTLDEFYKPTNSVSDERWQAMLRWLNKRKSDNDLSQSLKDNRLVL